MEKSPLRRLVLALVVALLVCGVGLAVLYSRLQSVKSQVVVLSNPSQRFEVVVRDEDLLGDFEADMMELPFLGDRQLVAQTADEVLLNATAWGIPGDESSYEYYFSHQSDVSETAVVTAVQLDLDLLAKYEVLLEVFNDLMNDTFLYGWFEELGNEGEVEALRTKWSASQSGGLFVLRSKGTN